MNKKKVIAIGLDGADFNLINQWLSQDQLPNLKKIKEQGSFGSLKTLIPPSTGPIWASFITGKNPGKHGLFDFMKREANSYNRILNDSNTLKAERIWDIAGKHNKKSIIFNIPLTHPAQKLNGIMITDMTTPPHSKNYAYPPAFQEELKSVVPNYTFFPTETFSKNNVNKFYNTLVKTLAQNSKIIKYLLKNKEWDIFIGVIIVGDLLKHGLFFTLDQNHPLYDKNFAKKHSNKILELYKKIDDLLGEIIKLKEENTYLMLMSDHGFGSLYYFLNINSFLVKNGFIKFKKNIWSQLKLLMFKSGFTLKNVYKIFEKLKLASLKHKIGGGRHRGVYQILKKVLLSFDDIDWLKTKAYSYCAVGQIHINLKGREPQGVVDQKDLPKVIEEIKQALSHLKDPIDSKEPLIEKIYLKKDLYNGKYLNDSPDIIVMPKTLKNFPFASFDFGSNKIFEKAFGTTGTHRIERGIFYLIGPGIKQNHLINNVKILDLAPTILSLINLPIPEDMDGKILKDIYIDKSSFSPAKEKKSSAQKKIKEVEEAKEEIMNRLKSLGYI